MRDMRHYIYEYMMMLGSKAFAPNYDTDFSVLTHSRNPKTPQIRSFFSEKWLARAGDVEAFARLYEEIYRDLYRFALYTLKNTHDAEDAVSDTVADAWQGIRGLRRTEAFRAWMFRILTNKCRRRLGQYANKALSLPEDLAEEPRDIGRNIDVRRAFAALSDEERMILALNIFGGYTSREIGRLLHMSNNTVRSKQSRALKKMEARLER